jgi:hypothetical protein
LPASWCWIGYEPRIVGNAVGTTLIFNGCCGAMAFGLSFWAGSRFPAPTPTMRMRFVESAAICSVLLVFMEIRHTVNGGDVYRATAA